MTERPATYCPDCGAVLAQRSFEGRERQYCPDCERFIWQNAKPCVGVVVRDGNKALLIKRAIPPDVGAWAPPGGALEPDEPPAVGAARELREETNLEVNPADLTLLDTRHSSLKEKYVLSIGYVVSYAHTDGEIAAASEVTDARFFTLPEAQEMQNQMRDYTRVVNSFEHWNRGDQAAVFD